MIPTLVVDPLGATTRGCRSLSLLAPVFQHEERHGGFNAPHV